MTSLIYFSLLAFSGLGAPGSAPGQDLEYRRLPGLLAREEASRIGEWIMDVEFSALEGEQSSLSAVAGERGLLIAMRDPECPLSKKYSPRLRALEEEAARMGLGLLYVGMDTRQAALEDVDLHGLGGTYAVDPAGEIARELDARTSTEVFVIDAGNTLVYRGMIDDQYGLGYAKAAAERSYLLEALEAVCAGDVIEAAGTTAQGCKLQLESVERAPRDVTWHNRISRIVQNRCQTCHRPGEAGPFALMNYGQVNKRRSMIEWALEEHVMPPWYADEASGPWSNDTSLTGAEHDDFLAWIAADAPEGESADAPLERQWVDGWSIGEPDLVVTLPEAYRVPAEGVVDYKYFYVKVDTAQDRWVEAVEVRSSAPQVVHHALVFLESPEVLEAIKRNPRDRKANRAFQSGVDSYFASSVPGQHGLKFPAGAGKLLPAGAWLKFQLHYTPDGREVLEQTSIALRFSETPLVEVETVSAINRRFTIPPHAFDYAVTSEFRFPEAGTLLSLFPHTHLRGNRFLCELVYPDGREEAVLELPFYDFNWQLNYLWQTPLSVPAGTRLRATAWYDNTADNPANPDPGRSVRFGEQTWEEMMICYVNWIPTRARVVEAGARSGSRGTAAGNR